MYKTLCILTVLISVCNVFTTTSFSSDLENSAFFFYPLKGNEIKEYFGKYHYLLNIENNSIPLTDQLIDTFFKNFIGKKSIESLLLESYFRYTKNKTVHKKIKEYIQKNKLADNFSQSLLRLYNAKLEKPPQGTFNEILYNCQDKYFDENINLFIQEEVSVFDGELNLVLFKNNWHMLKFDKNKQYNKESIGLIYGGGTNCLTMFISRFINISFDQFKKQAINYELFTERYKNWTTVELKKEDFFEQCGADNIFISYGVGPDVLPEIESAMFALHLYSNKLKKGYQVVYSMNFSKYNNNYLLRERIWNQLLFQLYFTSINSTE